MILVKNIEIDVKDESDHIQFDLNEEYVGTTDYEKLRNKPKLNGNEIIGEVEEIDPTVPLWAKEETRPVYTGRCRSYGRRFCNICINNRTR